MDLAKRGFFTLLTRTNLFSTMYYKFNDYSILANYEILISNNVCFLCLFQFPLDSSDVTNLFVFYTPVTAIMITVYDVGISYG